MSALERGSSAVEHPLVAGRPPHWATEWGEDRFGVFVTLRVGGAGQRLRWVPPGRFRMGSPEDEPGRWTDELPHVVEITRGYWLGDTPCTQALWHALMEGNPSRFPDDDRRPVESVSWDDVQGFLARLRESLGDSEFRLPTEAEWERACRAGTSGATFAGDVGPEADEALTVLDRIGWYKPNSQGQPQPVALKEPNALGLHDMLGNVHEWCEDLVDFDGEADQYGMQAYVEGARDPVSRQGSVRVARGGSWNSVARGLRAAFRGADAPDVRFENLGFRLARGPLVPGGD
ncbi:MAG: formylglycine-generating enzyme family protein [Planctomycetota bacterium]